MAKLKTVPESQAVCARGREAGLDAVGIATAAPFTSTRSDLEERKSQGIHGGMAFTYRRPERSTDPRMTLPSAEALVVGAISYRRDEPTHSGDRSAGGRVARYSWIDHYAILRDSLTTVAKYLKENGWKAVVVADDNALVDREAAYRAGIGWYGKNANLLLPGQGSWFVLGSIITNAPLTPTGPLVEDGCGSCTKCIDKCPTQAIVAPGVVDARRCLAWLVQAPGTFPVEHRVALGDRIYGCDDCQEVCPLNRVAERKGLGGATSEAPEPLEPWVDLLEILAADDDTLLDRHGRWYISGRDPKYLRRNALVALANIASPTDPRVVKSLEAALRDPEPLVRSHAVWAVRRLGLESLIELVQQDDSAEVLSELSIDVPKRNDLA